MAVTGVELEIIAAGLSVNRVDKGTYVQNLEVKENTWRVRSGFGQVGQFDTGLGLTTGQSGNYGYTKHLGSHSILTDFGDIQIISVMSGRAFTGEEEDQGTWHDLYFVSIFDVTTRSRWEDVIIVHTSQFNESIRSMPQWHGVYESDRNKNYESYPRSLEKPVFFTEFGDMLLFGNENMGMYGYNPATFYKGRRKQIDGIATNDWKRPYSESSLIWVVHPTDGLFANEWKYMNTSSFPVPVDAVMTKDFRIAMAAGREVFFSDGGMPASIITDNVIVLPTDRPIVAIEEMFGSLLVFTESELFHYTPPLDVLQIGGRITRLSDSIGALSPSAMTKGDEVLYWADRNGIYSTDGSMSIATLSEDIAPLFYDQISSPMTSYYVDSGFTTLAGEQPRLTYDLKDKTFISLAYDATLNNLFVAAPLQNAILALNGASWSLWPLESSISPTQDVVGVTANIENPWVVARDGEVFVVGSVETYDTDDVSVNWGTGSPVDNNLNAKSYSYSVLQLGIGGSLDRTVDISEDNRTMAGYYKNHTDDLVTGSDGYFFLDEPIELPDNFWFSPPVTASNVVLFPLRIVPDTRSATYAGAILDLDLVFTFDDSHWEPVLITDTDQIDVMLPPTRTPTAAGWGLAPGTPQATAEVTYTSASHQIELRWSGAYCHTQAGSFSWQVNVGGTDYAVMNCNRDYKNDLLFLPFKRKVQPPTNATMSMGITPTVATMMNYDGITRPLGLYTWEYASINNRHTADDVAQPIDWCMKSAQIGLDVDGQVKSRGVYARFLSHGRGDVQQGVTWRHGLINAVLGSDWKDWVSQIIDYDDDIQEAHSKTPLIAGTYINGIRTRIIVSGIELYKTFNNQTADILWGDKNSSTNGNYLIDDEEYDVLSISESVKGDSFSWMLFGHLRNRAEKLVIGSIKAVLRPAGGRRRTGR